MSSEEKPRRKIASLSGATFAVYLWHPQVLRIFDWNLPFLNGMMRWALGTVIIFVIVLLISRLMRIAEDNGSAFVKRPLAFTQRALGLR